MIRLVRAGLVSALLACGCSVATAAETILQPDLSVEHSAFVLKLPDGRVLKGAQLQGATLHVALDGGQVGSIRLTSITPDPDDPDLLRHEFQVEDAPGHWIPACQANYHGETWGFPVALPEGHPGREAAITLTCAAGAVGKCARFGYKPWAKGPNGEDLLSHHAACVHMVRADYCGDGQPHTKDGTMIDLYDRIGVQSDTDRNNPEYGFEAGWSPDGAVCVARTRWPDLATLDSLRAQCPALPLGPACTEDAATLKGALTFNRSRIKARLGE